MPAYWQKLQQQVADLRMEATAVIDAAEKDDRNFSDEERTKLSDLKAKREATEGDLALAIEQRDAEDRLPSYPDANTVAVQRAAEEPTGKTPTPFKSLAEQLQAVVQASRNPYGPIDPRLQDIQAALGANEAVPAEGGWRVQTDIASGLMNRLWETGQLFKKTDRTTVSSNANGMKFNALDETSRATGSRWGGIRGYWLAEAATKTASKPLYRQAELTLNKLAALYYATDELLQDTSALEQEVSRAFTSEFSFLVDDAIIRGSGAGQPLGILGHAGTISVAKETGQGAATIVAENIWKMYARMAPWSLPRAEWYVNVEVWPQLFQLAMGVGVGGVPLYQPAGGISAAPYGTLMGRPINAIEHAEALGTVGDIIFADFNQYKTIEKGGIDTASSIHVAFTTDETCFRWVLRVDGQPKYNTALTPYKGTGTLASFVTLATRA